MNIEWLFSKILRGFTKEMSFGQSFEISVVTFNGRLQNNIKSLHFFIKGSRKYLIVTYDIPLKILRFFRTVTHLGVVKTDALNDLMHQ